MQYKALIQGFDDSDFLLYNPCLLKGSLSPKPSLRFPSISCQDLPQHCKGAQLRACAVRQKYRYWGLYWGSIGIIGYILGLYWDNGKENGKYYLGFRIGAQDQCSRTLRKADLMVFGPFWAFPLESSPH